MDLRINIPDSGALKRVVIVGGGFAGLQIAKKLDNKIYQIVLIDKNNYHQFQPLMYQVATGGLEPGSISYPHRKIFRNKENLYIRMCKARSVVPQRKVVVTNLGEISYDYLVIATGCDTNFFGNESLKETTFPLKSVSESILMRNRLFLTFEEALNIQDEQDLSDKLTFVVVGGGATGVELSGTLAEMRKNILPKDYPGLDINKVQIHLVDGSPRLLFGMSEKASENAAKELRKRGVIIHHEVFVTSYEDNLVRMSNGKELRSANVLWVAGVTPNSLAGMDESSYFRNRLLVDDYNQVKGYEDIFAIGDTALLISDKSPKGHPQVAQVALQMAKRLAKNLNNKAVNKPLEKFEYVDKGSLATIGKNAAVADLGKFKFSGVVAWWLWLFVHIMTIIGMRNKVAVFIDWIWNYLNYGVSLRLFIRPKESKIYKEDFE
jgi:NADH dehydrogenase